MKKRWVPFARCVMICVITEKAPTRRLKRSLARKLFVPILYQNPAFDAFDDFSDFLESITCEISKVCQVRGSIPGTIWLPS